MTEELITSEGLKKEKKVIRIIDGVATVVPIRDLPQEQPRMILGSCRVKVHPAQDFTETQAFTCQFIDYDTPNGEETLPTLISSDRRTFILTADRENELNQANLKVKYKPLNMNNRWSITAIDYFLKNPNNSTELSLCYEKIREQLDFYLDWSHPELYDFFSVWLIGTYFYQLFSSYPYVELFSSKASGKTKLLLLSSLISFNGYHVTGITPATLFRMVQDNRCSLLIDEAEYDKHDIKDLRGLLSGYTKGILVPRTVEKKVGGVKRHDLEFFEVYSPKMLAGISGIENILADRCITAILEKPNLQTAEGKNKANRYPDTNDKKWSDIRDLLYSSMLEKFNEIRRSYETLANILNVVNVVNDVAVVLNPNIESMEHPSDDNINYTNYMNISTNIINEYLNKIKDNIDARDRQLWLPLYAVAYSINWSLFESIVDYSIQVVKRKKETNLFEDNDTILFEWLIKNISEPDMYSIRKIKVGLLEEVGEEWWVNERSIGKALRRINVVLKAGRTQEGSRVYLDPKDIHEKALRFGVDLTRVESERKEQTQVTLAEVLDVHKDDAELEGEDMVGL